MKWCPKCQTRGYADSETKCPNCGGSLFTQVQLTGTPAAAERTGRQESVREPVRGARQEPVREPVRGARQEPVREAGRTARQEPIREAGRTARQEPVREAGQTARQEPVREAGQTVRQEPTRDNGTRGGDISRPGNRGGTPNPPRVDPALVIRIIEYSVIALALIGAVIWIIVNWEAISTFLSYFAGGFVIGIILCLALTRFRTNPRAIIGIGAICGVLSVMFCYNLFDITGAVSAMVSAIAPSVIICGTIYYLLRSIR